MKQVIRLLRGMKVAVRKSWAYRFFAEMYVADVLICFVIALLDTIDEKGKKKMKKVQEFIGYFMTIAFVLIMICIVIGIGLVGFTTTARYWSMLFGAFSLSDFILIVSVVAAIVSKIVKFVKGRK